MNASTTKAALNVMQQGRVVETIALNEGVLVIGRDRCDLILDDPEVSTKHCKIEFVSGAYQIFDLHSTNGIFLNGQKIAKARLNSGDKIRVGKTEFVFQNSEMAPRNEDYEVSFDPSKFPIPSLPGAAEIDALLEDERSRYFAAMRIILDVTYSDGSKEVLSAGHELVIGRLSGEGKFNRDEELSRKHARVFLDENALLWIEDLGSTNGVLVNKLRINKPHKLAYEDSVKVGRCQMKVYTRPGAEYGG